MKVISIIPARGGSKGIFKKNLVHLLGKPLIDYTIEAAQKSRYITDIVVTSDDAKILEHAKKFEGIALIDRPKSLAEDCSPTEPVLVHVLENSKEKYDYLVLLQPTSPLRTSEDIDTAFSKLINSEASSLISVSVPSHHPLKSFVKDENGYLKGLVNNKFPFMPRQELPKVVQPNGAIYIIKVSEFLKNNKLFTSKTIDYVMSAKKSVDIDCMSDIENIEYQLKK